MRIGTSGAGTDLKFSAFKNVDGTVSVQVINNGASAQSVTVAPSGFTANSASGVVSAQGTDFGSLCVTLAGGQATASIPGHAMATFVLSDEPPSGSNSSCTGAGSGGSTSGGSGGGSSTGGSSGCTTAKYGQCAGQGTLEVLDPCDMSALTLRL